MQRLRRRDAKLCLDVEKFYLSALRAPRNARLVLAVSGGADSTALAVIFHYLAPRLNLKLFAMHINHGLRKEAAADAEFAQALCSCLDMPCSIANIDANATAREKRCGIEEACRIGRYAELAKFQKDMDADFILVAHQADDLCEDVLMRLTRGAGWPALGGMKARTGSILRPLLFATAAGLRLFLANLPCPWREDESNASLAFRRNRMRHLVMPLLRAENPAIGHSIANLHSQAQIDEAYWHDILNKALEKNPWQEDAESSGLCLPRQLLATLHPAARLRLYHMALKHIRNAPGKIDAIQARADTLLKLDTALARGNNGKCFQFPGGVSSVICDGAIHFLRDKNSI